MRRASTTPYSLSSPERLVLPVDAKLLDVLVCPVCKGPLVYRKEQAELICSPCRLAYPVRDDIPVMLEDEARKLPADEEL